MDKNYKGFEINFVEEKDLWVCTEANLQNISFKKIKEDIDNYEKQLKKEKRKTTPIEAYLVDSGYKAKAPFKKIVINSAISATYTYRDDQKIEIWIKDEEGTRNKIHADEIIRPDKIEEVKKEYDKLQLAKSAYRKFLNQSYYQEKEILEKLSYSNSEIKKILKSEDDDDCILD